MTDLACAGGSHRVVVPDEASRRLGPRDMIDRIGQQLQVGLVLLLCALTATLPNRGLHVSLCSASGILSSGGCACEDVVALPVCCSHGDASVDTADPGCGEEGDPYGDCEDCCLHTFCGVCAQIQETDYLADVHHVPTRFMLDD